MPRYLRTEIWSDLQCAGGARLAVVPDVVQLSCTQKTSADDVLTLSLPVRSVAWPHIRARRVVRVVFADGSFEEWRILRDGKLRSNGVHPGTVECVSIAADLGRAILERVEADGFAVVDFEAVQLPPADHLTAFVLPALNTTGLTWLTLGTIEPTDPIDMVYSRTSALEAVRQIAQVSNCEFRLRRDGTTGYLLDIVTTIGSTAPIRTIQLEKNLTGIQWSENADEQTTRILGTGTAIDSIHGTIARARWRVSGVAGSVLTLEDPDTGEGPLAFDDQLNGLYLRKPNGTYTEITDCVESTQTVTVVSATGISVDDIVTIHRDATGGDLTMLRAPGAESTYGIYPGVLDRQDLPSTINFVRNSSLQTWIAGLPDSWVQVGDCTITETTDPTLWQHGGKSARVQTTDDGDGIETEWIDITPTARRPFFTGSFSFYLAAGRVRAEIEATNGTRTWTFPEGTDGKAFSTQLETWIELVIAGIDLYALGATAARLRLVQDGLTPCDFYVDTAQLSQFHEQEPYIEGAGPNKLWHAINARLRTHSDPQVQIRVDLIDLERMHPNAFAHESLILGGTIRATDPTLGIDVTTRLIEITRDLITNRSTSIVLSNRPEDLTDLLVRSRQAGRQLRYGDTVRELTVQATFDKPTASPATISVRLAARPANAQIFYVVQDASLPVPITGAAAWTEYTQSFTVDQLTTDDLIVAAYAQLGTHTSAVESWPIWKAIRPQIDMSLMEANGGELTIGWTPSGDVVAVALYREVDGWPTTNGDPDGPLDPTKYLGKWGVTPDAGGMLADGTIDIGRTSFVDDYVYENGDDAHVIAVPFDTAGRTGPRATAVLSMAGVPQAALDDFTPTLSTPGTSCSDPASISIGWTPNAQVDDGTHDLLVYRSVNGAPRQLVTRITSPASVTSFAHQQYQYIDNALPPSEVVYSWDLVDGSEAVLASGSAAPMNLRLTTACPGPPSVSLNASKTKITNIEESYWRVVASGSYGNAPAGSAVRFLQSTDGGASWIPFGFPEWSSVSGGGSLSREEFKVSATTYTLHLKIELRASASGAATLLADKVKSITITPT